MIGNPLTDPYTVLVIAAVACLCCVSAAILRRRRDARDLEALAEAVWECPDRVPDTWVKEFRR